jgi:hypothetical protein
MHHIDNVSQVLKAVIADSLNSNSWVGIWHIAALSSVLHKAVNSIYPAEAVGIATNSMVRYVLNRSLYPRTEMNTAQCIYIMWTSCSSKCTQLWQPNHFVVCFSDECFQFQNSTQAESRFSDKQFCQAESKFSDNTQFSEAKSQFQNQTPKSQSNKGIPKKRKLSKEASSTKAKYLITNKGKDLEDFKYDV